MSDYSFMNSLVNEYNNLGDAIKDQFKKIATDKNIPLNDRWAIFKLVENVLPCETYGDGNIDTLDSGACLYDDFYIERHETVEYISMYERIVDREKYTQDQIDAWREAVLADGNGSFEFDW